VKGISTDLLNKLKTILSNIKVIESSEIKKQYYIRPWDMHHVLAHAKLIISDSQTMAAEAMVLGVPSIRVNSFVGKLSYLQELESKYGLGFGFLPSSEKAIIDTLKKLLNDSNTSKDWHFKTAQMLKDKINLNEWMINFLEKEFKHNNNAE
jgi:predicted glycosyltransferase